MAKAPKQPNPANGQTAPRVVTLDKADYWELRAAIRDLELAQIEARQKVALAGARQNAVLERLAEAHGFDGAKRWAFDDDACTLTEADRAAPA